MGARLRSPFEVLCTHLQYYICYRHPNKAKEILRTDAIFLCHIFENYYLSLIWIRHFVPPPGSESQTVQPLETGYTDYAVL